MVTIDIAMAEQVYPWLVRDGAILKWKSVNLSNPGAWWLTPLGADKPSWQAGNEPETLHPTDLCVVQYQEVKRIRIYVRPSSSGLTLKLTDDSSRRLEKALRQVSDASGQEASYHFEGDQAVISVKSDAISFVQWSHCYA